MTTMDLYGTFLRFLRRNEKTGESRFTVRTPYPDPKIIICSGVVQNYPRFIPLRLTGDYIKEAEKSVFDAKEVSAHGYAFEEMYAYLTGKEFASIGEKAAKEILNTLGIDLFAVIRNNSDIQELTHIVNEKTKRISSKGIYETLNKLYRIIVMEDLQKELIKRGGDYHNAALLYSRYLEDTPAVLTANPYVLLYSGTELKICEEMAKEREMEYCDRHRMRGIVEHAMRLNAKNGNTRITFHALCKKIGFLEEKAGNIYHTIPLFVAEEILSDRYHIEYTEDEVYVYLTEDYESERMIADHAERILDSSVCYPDSKISIEQIEEICHVQYSPDQKETFKALEKTGIKIITGGPGTGKTTVLNGLLTKYEKEHPYNTIALCAPTGRAAKRMRDCTGRDAFTIHKLLGIRPYETILNSTVEKLDADCIVIDESSMIDTFIMARLLSSVKNGGLVLLLGDKDQLPSVNAGNVFEDLLKSEYVETYYLKSVFRQDKRSLIVENGKRVINGNPHLMEDKSFKVRVFENEKDMITEAARIAEKCYEKNCDFKLYSPSKNRKFASGTIQMNTILQKIRSKGEREEISFGHYTYSKGDIILFNRNNYDKGYYNGQEGVIKDIQQHTGGYTISIEADGERYNISGQELADIELAYAITAHKSQGDECTNAIILVPKEPVGLLKRQLLYVEITRARKNVLILTEKGALESAIGRKGLIKRNTGLKEMLIARSA